MTQQKETTVQMVIPVPMSRLRQIQESLQSMDLEVDPLDNMIVFSTERGGDAVFTGDMIHDLVEDYNKLARAENLPQLRAPEDPEARYHLLKFLHEEVQWYGDCKTNILAEEADTERLEELLERFPGLREE